MAKPSRIRSERQRSNVLKAGEYWLIERLCERMPAWVKPDMLTALGLFGSLVIFASLWLARGDKGWLWLAVLGLAIHWFGDSLDGRIAYFRNTPRKWYGWSLDINADWLSATIMGLGFYFYLPSFKIVSFVFVVAYGGAMIVALMRYKITDRYTIDTCHLGPTEMRILLAGVLVIEVYRDGTLLQFAFVGSLLLIFFNFLESWRVLRLGDERDRAERVAKAQAGHRSRPPEPGANTLPQQ